MQGILSIVEGENPRIIVSKLTELLGEKYAVRISDQLSAISDQEGASAPSTDHASLNTDHCKEIAKTLNEKFPNADLGKLNNDSEKLLSMIREVGLSDKLPKVSPEKMEDFLLDIMLTWATDFYNKDEEGPLLDTEVEHYGW